MSRSLDAPPVIDLAPLLGAGTASSRRSQTLAALAEACTTWGAFQATGHGVPGDLETRFLEQMRRFFRLPDHERHALLRTADNPFGFYDRELTKNRPDWKQVFDCACERVGGADSPRPDGVGMRPSDRNQWPESLPEFRSAVQDWIGACQGLSILLLRALCESLGAEPDLLDPCFVDVHTSFLRLNHYPVCDEPADPETPLLPESGHLGVHHHTDAGALTLVFQDETDGLQIYRNDRWHLIERAPGALIVHLADMLQVWSNDRYRSPMHRVIARSNRERFSAPYFFNPSYQTECHPLDILCRGESARYHPVNWGEFRRRRTDGDYADYGEEVQIAQYRISSR